MKLARLQSRVSPIAPPQVRSAWDRNPLSPRRIEGRAGVERRRRIKARDLYTCKCCGRVDPEVEVDHIVPLAEGGTEDDANLQLLCRECHLAKTLAEASRRW